MCKDGTCGVDVFAVVGHDGRRSVLGLVVGKPILACLLILQAGHLLLDSPLLGNSHAMLLPDASLLFGHLDLGPDGSQERVEMVIEILFGDDQIPFQELQKLLLHQVDLGSREAKWLVSSYVGVFGPVLVLGRRVVEELGGKDERSQEDSVDGASETLGHGWKSLLESGQVDQGSHEGGDLDVGSSHQRRDELLERWELRERVGSSRRNRL